MSYRPYEPEQEMLLPASLQDWLPKGHLAYFIGDTVDALDLKAFYAPLRWRWLAQPAVPPVDDGQGAGLWLRYGRVQLAQDGASAA